MPTFIQHSTISRVEIKQNRNSDTDNRLMVTRGEGGAGRATWLKGSKMYGKIGNDFLWGAHTDIEL